eukprot:9501744-Pyramimonas_sp.AAC.1
MWFPAHVGTHASHASWPHKELHRRPVGMVHMRFRARLGAPLARFVAPQGAPPKAPVAGFRCGHPPTWTHPSHVWWPHMELHRRP